MVDNPKLTPQVFAKRGGGVPRLTAQALPSLRQIPSVTAFASDSLADTLVSFADDAQRLQAMENQQFGVNQQQFDVAMAEIEEAQTLDAEEAYTQAEVLFAQASQSIVERSDPDSIIPDSVEAYDNAAEAVMNREGLSTFQKNYLRKKFDTGRNAVSVSAAKQQIAIRQQQKAEARAEAQRNREVALFRNPSVEEFDKLRAGLSKKEQKELADIHVQALVLENPDRAQELLDSRLYDSIVDGDTLAGYQRTITAELNRKGSINSAKKKAEVDGVKDDLANYKEVTQAGEVWKSRDGKTEDDLAKSVLATGDADLIADFEESRFLASQGRAISASGLPVLEAAHLANQASEAEGVDALTLKRNQMIERRIAETRTAIRSDNAMQFAETQGLVDPLTVSVNDPRSLAQREKDHKAFARHHNVNDAVVPILKPLEKDQLISELKVPDDRAFLNKATTLNTSLSQRTQNNILRQISKEAPAYSIAVPLAGIDPAAAKAIHRGSIARVESGGNLRVNGNIYSEAFSKAVDGALVVGGEKGDAAYYNAVMEASKSYLIGTDVLPDATGGYTKAEVESALSAVIGEIAYDGYWSADRVKTFAPKGVSASEFESVLDNIEMDDFVRAVGGTPVAEDQTEFTIEDIRDRVQYRYRANGVYALEFKSGTKFNSIIVKETGEPALFYYNRLLNK